ncbi:hypothetical protein GALMADRAFT_148809 [Galerina marginata CBS 339.88]|uniref:Uncharacterized protein n=2 Tax=Galerina marginata (strain CBS 339.88) TaxID=685588 RepID=A0A067S5Y6_GALM3|nr:hypothetical protein GALMADRAFT_148809 [Galerina marginata CBS 339.88]
MVLMTFHAPGFQSLKAEDATLVNKVLHTWFPEFKGPKYTFVKTLGDSKAVSDLGGSKPLETLRQYQI